MKYIIYLLFLFSSFYTSAEVFKWVDAAGRVHYADESGNKGGKKIDLPELTSYKPRKIKALKKKVILEPESYERIELLSPEVEETIENNDASISVRILIEPALFEGHYFKVFLDGAALPHRLTETTSLYNDIELGAHELKVYVYNKEDVRLKKSEPVRFYLRKAPIVKKPRSTSRRE